MDELRIKASKIKLVAFDVDGVLTDGTIFYSEKGEEIKAFNAKDGQGMVMLTRQGLITAIITARSSALVSKRAEDLGLTHVYQGAKNKILVMQELVEKYNLDYSEIAYIGDDLPDICVLEKVGLSFCPADAVDEVKAICHMILTKPGGKGAVREMTDFILSSKKVGIDKTVQAL